MKKSFFTISCFIGVAAIISSCSNSGPTQFSSAANGSNEVAYFSSKTLMSTGPTSHCTPAMAASLAYPGNLEVVRQTASGNQLEALYWAPGLSTWYASGTFASNVYDDPALCVNRADNLLQVAVRESTNPYQLHHYYRDNSGTWHAAEFFGSNCAGAPSMISNIQSPYNLELLVQDANGTQIKHMYRDQNFNWYETGYLPNGSYSRVIYPSLTQTPDGLLHAVALGDKVVNGLDTWYVVYWVRNSSLVWQIMDASPTDCAAPKITALSDNGVDIVYKEPPTGGNNLGLDLLYAPQSTHKLSFDGWMSSSIFLTAYGITTLNGNEIHLSYCNWTSNPYNQHWKLMH